MEGHYREKGGEKKKEKGEKRKEGRVNLSRRWGKRTVAKDEERRERKEAKGQHKMRRLRKRACQLQDTHTCTNEAYPAPVEIESSSTL